MARKSPTRSTASHTRPAATEKPNAISIDPRYSGLRVYAYGPVRVSSAFFFTYPAAYPRSQSPANTGSKLHSRNRGAGRAKTKNTIAVAKPSGTRTLRATRCHCDPPCVPAIPLFSQSRSPCDLSESARSSFSSQPRSPQRRLSGLTRVVEASLLSAQTVTSYHNGKGSSDEEPA